MLDQSCYLKGPQTTHMEFDKGKNKVSSGVQNVSSIEMLFQFCLREATFPCNKPVETLEGSVKRECSVCPDSGQSAAFFSQQTLNGHHLCAWVCVGCGDNGENAQVFVPKNSPLKALGPSRLKVQMNFTEWLASCLPETLWEADLERRYPTAISWNRKCLRVAAIR